MQPKSESRKANFRDDDLNHIMARFRPPLIELGEEKKVELTMLDEKSELNQEIVVYCLRN